MGASLSDFAEELAPTRSLSAIFTTEPYEVYSREGVAVIHG